MVSVIICSNVVNKAVNFSIDELRRFVVEIDSFGEDDFEFGAIPNVEVLRGAEIRLRQEIEFGISTLADQYTKFDRLVSVDFDNRLVTLNYDNPFELDVSKKIRLYEIIVENKIKKGIIYFFSSKILNFGKVKYIYPFLADKNGVSVEVLVSSVNSLYGWDEKEGVSIEDARSSVAYLVNLGLVGEHEFYKKRYFLTAKGWLLV